MNDVLGVMNDVLGVMNDVLGVMNDVEDVDEVNEAGKGKMSGEEKNEKR